MKATKRLFEIAFEVLQLLSTLQFNVKGEVCSQKLFVFDEAIVESHHDIIIYVVLMYNLNPHRPLCIWDMMHRGSFPLFHIDMRTITITC